jgi:hypothetical protein
MKFKSEDIKELLDEEDVEGFELVEMGDWVSEGKYECSTSIFKFQDKFYLITDSRTGSHYTDWYYESSDWGDEIECTEVVPKEITKIKWVAA